MLPSSFLGGDILRLCQYPDNTLSDDEMTEELESTWEEPALA
jgi:hypothetical protein